MESINRPFTASSFERNLAKFQDYIEEITLKYSTDPIEDRRQKILGNKEKNVFFFFKLYILLIFYYALRNIKIRSIL